MKLTPSPGTSSGPLLNRAANPVTLLLALIIVEALLSDDSSVATGDVTKAR